MFVRFADLEAEEQVIHTWDGSQLYYAVIGSIVEQSMLNRNDFFHFLDEALWALIYVLIAEWFINSKFIVVQLYSVFVASDL